MTAGFTYSGNSHISKTVKEASSVNQNLNQKGQTTAKKSSFTKQSILINHTNNTGLNYSRNYQTSNKVDKSLPLQMNIHASKVADSNLIKTNDTKMCYKSNSLIFIYT